MGHLTGEERFEKSERGASPCGLQPSFGGAGSFFVRRLQTRSLSEKWRSTRDTRPVSRGAGAHTLTEMLAGKTGKQLVGVCSALTLPGAAQSPEGAVPTGFYPTVGQDCESSNRRKNGAGSSPKGEPGTGSRGDGLRDPPHTKRPTAMPVE